MIWALIYFGGALLTVFGIGVERAFEDKPIPDDEMTAIVMMVMAWPVIVPIAGAATAGVAAGRFIRARRERLVMRERLDAKVLIASVQELEYLGEEVACVR